MRVTTQPLLSIIIPAYNTARFIGKCIESCENQDIPSIDYEIIIINDGSTDDTLQVVSKLQKQYLNIRVINQINQGQSVARNEGVKIAIGKYIWFVDSDDYIANNCLGMIIDIMEKNKLDALSIYSSPLYSCEDLLNIDYKELEDIPSIKSGVQFLLEKKSVTVTPWGYVFNTDFWRDNKFFFTPNIYYEDALLIPIVISKCERIATVGSHISCYSYIDRSGSTMNSLPNVRKINGYISIVNAHLEYSKNIKNTELKKYFEDSASLYFIRGINMYFYYGKWSNVKVDFLKKVRTRPNKIFAKSFGGKVYQYIVLQYPVFYCLIRYIFSLLNMIFHFRPQELLILKSMSNK